MCRNRVCLVVYVFALVLELLATSLTHFCCVSSPQALCLILNAGTNVTSRFGMDRFDQDEQLVPSSIKLKTNGEIDTLVLFKQGISSACELADGDDGNALVKLQDIVAKMNKPLQTAARAVAGDELWSKLVFLNIRKTKARILHGCKIANRTKICDWDLIPTKGDRECDRCPDSYPCEYTSVSNTVKCRECRINGKGCSWAGLADPAIDDAVFGPKTDTTRLSPEADPNTHTATLQRATSQSGSCTTRSRPALVIEETRTIENDKVPTAKVQASPRPSKRLPVVLLLTVDEFATKTGRDIGLVAATKTTKQNKIESMPSSGLMTCSKTTKEQVSQISQKGAGDGSASANARKRARENSTMDRKMEPNSEGGDPRAPRPNAPTLSMRSFGSSPKLSATGTFGGGPGYLQTNMPSLLAPMSASQTINIAGPPLNTPAVLGMFHRREKALENARASVQAMNPEELVEQAAKILVDYADLTLTMDSINQKWEQAIQMQREIIEAVLKRFNSFQTDLLDDIASVKRKWVGETDD
ncbi:hypothetical protein EV421DRAFT_1737428 [Armillaria borealis]|uniref:Zn(2)-C6 fungal-type domain-containing protein n=1 Tax=Armillaria borealis TaxID=47425 RepID=A0AA39JE45_9AGAR|nr:hypothetical protein EV421DRAFT_1737428 [Armillaria borealis]